MNAVRNNLSISDKEFNLFRTLIYEKAGINLSVSKRQLVVSRLSKRMRELDISSFKQYHDLVTKKGNRLELQNTIDFLTTNETYFFREPKHFDFVNKNIISNIKSGTNFKVWSAACSSGEEAYTIAMVLANKFGLFSDWKVFGTDINSDVVIQAERGLYPLTDSQKIPADFLREYCLKGVRSHEGTMLIDRNLKRHVKFERVNLNDKIPDVISGFDVVFLRNIMIYFDTETKQRLVDNIAERIKPGGYLFIGHSETLNQVSDRFKIIKPSICQKIK